MKKARPGQKVIVVQQMIFTDRHLLLKLGDVFTVTCVQYLRGKVTYDIKISPKEIQVGLPSENFEIYNSEEFEQELNEVLIKNKINKITF